MKFIFGIVTLIIGLYVNAETMESSSMLIKDTAVNVQKDTAIIKKGGLLELTLSQMSLSNWAAGGLNTISYNGYLNYVISVSKNKRSWENSLNLGFGMVRQGGVSGLWIKSDDKIDFVSKFGTKFGEKTAGAALFKFRSQFAPGFEDIERTNLISDILAPAYLVGALGVDAIPNKAWTFFLAPATFKGTIVMNDSLSSSGAYGVEEGEKFRSELGGYARVEFKKEVMKNIQYIGRLDLFSNYFVNPQDLDVNWENLISMQVNKYVNVTLRTHLIFDKDIQIEGATSQVQFKQVFAAGLAYKL